MQESVSPAKEQIILRLILPPPFSLIPFHTLSFNAQDCSGGKGKGKGGGDGRVRGKGGVARVKMDILVFSLFFFLSPVAHMTDIEEEGRRRGMSDAQYSQMGRNATFRTKKKKVF